MHNKIAIIGAGGHGKVVGEIALLNQYEVIDFFDDDLGQIDTFPFTIVNKVDQLKEYLNDYDAFFIAIGDNQIRSNKIKWLKNFNVNIVSLVHVDHDCKIEDFVHISPNASLSGNVKIGKFTHLGTATSVHPGICIGNNVKTAVGSKVFKDILDNTIYKD